MSQLRNILIAHERQIAARILKDEGPRTVNGRRYFLRSIATVARRQLARRLIADERYFATHYYHAGKDYWTWVDYDALSGVARMAGVRITIRVIRCAACNEPLPIGALVRLTDLGYVGDPPYHFCSAGTVLPNKAPTCYDEIPDLEIPNIA